jgi:hypothetical protein
MLSYGYRHQRPKRVVRLSKHVPKRTAARHHVSFPPKVFDDLDRIERQTGFVASDTNVMQRVR